MKLDILFLAAVVTATAPALADNTQSRSKGAQAPAAKPQSAEETMKITRQAMVHIAAAQSALEQDNTRAAKSALTKSQQALAKLYDAPMHAAVINELDEAIATAQRHERQRADGKDRTGKETLIPMDLAPVATSVRRYQAYVDPSVISDVDKAAEEAKRGDAGAAADALRLARNRMAIDLAFVPVEEAYVRVLAAQQALTRGDEDEATKLLRGVPVIVSQVQVSTPLVPIRFNLNAAAEAAEKGNWQQAQKLVQRASTELQQLEQAAPRGEVTAELGRLTDDVENLGKQMSGDDRPEASAIRDLAKRTRDIGA